MISASHIKEIAKKAGADMCGIAPIERMKNAPPEMNPGLLWPNVKSIVGFVFRIPRGVQRGIEEGYFRKDVNYEIAGLLFDAMGAYIMEKELFGIMAI